MAWHTTEDAGAVSLEAWKGQRKLTLYVENEGFVTFIKVTGPNIRLDMETGRVDSITTLESLRAWLREGE